jgi:hypothetical protein
MAGDFGTFGFGLCRAMYGDGTEPATMAALVEGWISETRSPGSAKWAGMCEWEIIQKAPELGLEFVLSVLATRPDEEILGSLAVGPLENLLAFHGTAMIEKIEEEARRSPQFCSLLNDVWQNKTPDEIWQRVLKVRAVPNSH